jgi:hypothetical protein
MDLPPLTMEALSKTLAEAPTSQELYDILFQYESEACLMFTEKEVTGDPQLLSTFYASYLISLLLIDQMSVSPSLVIPCNCAFQFRSSHVDISYAADDAQ